MYAVRATSARVISTTLLALCMGTLSAYADRPLTVDDVLKTEDFGRAVITADGRYLAYEWLAPYESAPNVGTLIDLEDRSALAKIYSIDLAVLTEPKLLFDQDARGGYWLGSLSPDGAKLAVYWLISGEVSAGAFDFATQRLTPFQFTPNYFRFEHWPRWISSEELLYPTMPAGRQPAIVGKVGLVKRLNELWQKSLSGVEASATVILSAPNGSRDADVPRKGGLVRGNARTGTADELAEGYFYDLSPSPAGRYLAALREGGAVQPAVDRPPRALEMTHRDLTIVDHRSTSKALRLPCAGCNVVLGTMRWSTDGTRLTFFARAGGDGVEKTELFEYVPATNLLAKVRVGALKFACGTRRSSRLLAMGVGRGVAVFGRLADSREDVATLSASSCSGNARHDWFLLHPDDEPVNLTGAFHDVSGDLVGVAANSLFVLADDDVWRLEADGGRRNLTADIDAPLMHWGLGMESGARSDTALFTGEAIPTTRAILQTDDQIVSLDLKAGSHEVLDRPDRDAQLLAVTDTTKTAVFRRDTRSGSTLLLKRQRGITRAIASINRHLDDVAEVREAEISYNVPDGTRLSSCMFLPPNWDAAKRYPTIVHVYPNVSGACFSSDSFTFNPYDLRLLAAHGYIVMFAAAPGSLIRTPDGPTRSLTPTVLAAVDRAIRVGYADPNRLGVFGFSQGHHSALQVITETDRFKAAVAMYGISNFSSDYGTTALRFRLDSDLFQVGSASRYESMTSDNGLGVKPWEGPQRYVLNSPVFHANKIHTPLLILHSDFDSFPLGQSEEIFSALYRLREEAAYVTYWGEGHGNLSPANIRDMWQRIFRWFDERLVTPPDEKRADVAGQG